MSSILNPQLPQSTNKTQYWHGLHGSASALAIVEAFKSSQSTLLVITENNQQAIQLEHECLFFDPSVQILSFPDWETLPYDRFSPHQDIISQRLFCLSKLRLGQPSILFVPVGTLMHKLPPVEYVEQFSFVLNTGDHFNPNTIRDQLSINGYHSVDQVISHGEYALRGSVFDIFPMGSDTPYRIDLFDNEVDSIRSFDPDTQLSIEKIEQINILPAKEFPMTSDSIALFRSQWRDHFTGQPSQHSMYQSVVDGRPAAGIEYYLPLFFKETANLFDYLPQQHLIITDESLEQHSHRFIDEIKERYQQLNADIEHPILPPQELFLTTDQLFAELKSSKRCQQISETSSQAFDFKLTTPWRSEQKADANVKQRHKHLVDSIHQLIDEHKDRSVLFVAESSGRREILLELLNEAELTPTHCKSWQDFSKDTPKLAITTGPIELGFGHPKFTIITESQLFGDQVKQRRRRRNRKQDTGTVIHHLAELQPGSPVVHIEHGVGRYMGLTTLKLNGAPGEFLTLEYDGQDKLYVPIASLELISHYTGADADKAPLYKLGNTKWQKAKEKAAKKVSDVAAELLDIYARREAKPGFPHTIPEEYALFAEQFPFEETLDQERSINSVLDDMSTPKCMDRLVCGDVGFGKTEVALRAAFISVMNNRQTAILVPTTLLATQHYQTFCDRFADWPIKVETLSRFKSAKQQKEILEKLAQGEIDIVIATHKLLAETVKFKNLGLLIIDEEHRFGVKQKEKIKSLRASIDILTLTATPIPRTLNMSMSGIRDLSIIATPPQKRLSIKTFKRNYSKGTIREAIMREQHRGGQVYYLHNDVKTIEAQVEKLRQLIPEAKIQFAHGQMRERELERIMSDFYHQRFSVLVCSTIIETGIDVPTANTIIINRADLFGLAQLHQLRGRVGRSHHQAYAYLLTDPDRKLTKDAEKRLAAICEFEELGVGFHLASHDLEIRGAGELLGQDQSGQITTIGFSLYMEFLENAVNAMKQGKVFDISQPIETGPDINCRVTALIPETTIADPHLRLVQYKRIANARTIDELDELRVEFIDRFGKLQSPIQNLFQLAKHKLTASKLGIYKVEVNKKFAKLFFKEETAIDPDKVIQLMTQSPQRYRLEGGQNLKVLKDMPEEAERISILDDTFKLLQ